MASSALIQRNCRDEGGSRKAPQSMTVRRTCRAGPGRGLTGVVDRGRRGKRLTFVARRQLNVADIDVKAVARSNLHRSSAGELGSPRSVEIGGKGGASDGVGPWGYRDGLGCEHRTPVPRFRAMKTGETISRYRITAASAKAAWEWCTRRKTHASDAGGAQVSLCRLTE
jgi:hypothetical protein